MTSALLPVYLVIAAVPEGFVIISISKSALSSASATMPKGMETATNINAAKNALTLLIILNAPFLNAALKVNKFILCPYNCKVK